MTSIIYGFHSVEHALRASADQVLEVWVLRQRGDRRVEAVLNQASDRNIPVSRLEADELARKTGSNKHQGVAALIEEAAAWSEQRLLGFLAALKEPALVLILDGVTDPRNLGACLRTAEAAGAHAVVVPKDRSATLVPTARKTACGAAERLPFVPVTNLARCLRALQEQGVWIVGTAADAKSTIFQAKLSNSVALILGGEEGGLRRLTREHCDQMIKLPMHGQVESLNVSVAAGICLYEALRQRLK